MKKKIEDLQTATFHIYITLIVTKYVDTPPKDNSAAFRVHNNQTPFLRRNLPKAVTDVMIIYDIGKQNMSCNWWTNCKSHDVSYILGKKYHDNLITIEIWDFVPLKVISRSLWTQKEAFGFSKKEFFSLHDWLSYPQKGLCTMTLMFLKM
jgi:hypothetical protein